MRLSFVVPAHNEEASLAPLVEQIRAAVQGCAGVEAFEVLLVDDGSTDGTWRVIRVLAQSDPAGVRGIRLRRNFGKAQALAAGFEACAGDVVFTLDADLQDDPGEIPRFLAKLDEGHDLVSGWKQDRQDPVSRRLLSRVFNRITARLTGVRLHDFNCGFKCYRREVVESLSLYGELHRYIPVLAHNLGFRVAEIPVVHHPRRHGASRYGWERCARGLLDLLTVLSTTRWLHKPGHLFGGLGLLLGLAGSAALAYLAVLWLLGHGPIGGRPLLLFGVLAVIVGVHLLSLGIVVEFFVKFNQPADQRRFIAERVGGPPHHAA